MNKEFNAKAEELIRVSYRLAYLEDGGEYAPIEKFKEVTSWVLRTCKELSSIQGDTPEEEATICLSVLVGYSTTIHEVKSIQKILNRVQKVLPLLKKDLLKCQLLTYCYAEVYDERLAKEAREIINSWQNRVLTKEEERVKVLLGDLEKNIVE